MLDKELLVERMFRKFSGYSEAELELWVRDTLRTAFDENEPREVGVEALENYLALQYFLYKFRLSMATDVMEQKSLTGLVSHFAGIFVDRNGMDERLYSYCIEAMIVAKSGGKVEEMLKWNRLSRVVMEVLR